MKKLFALSILFLSLLTKSSGQNNLPPAYEIKSDTAFKHDLPDSNWQLLADKEGKLTIDQISSPALLNQFRSRQQSINLRDTTASVIWFRYRLKNTTDQELKIALQSKADQDEFHIIQTGSEPKHFITGVFYPWNQKDGFKRGNYIPLILEPGQEITINQRSYKPGAGISARIPIGFVNTDMAIEKELNEYDSEFEYSHSLSGNLGAIMIGMLLISAFFNLISYRMVREKSYLYFSLFLIFLLINRLYFFAGYYFFFNKPSLLVWTFAFGYAWDFVVFFLTLFLRQILHIRDRYPRWNKMLVILSYVLFFSVVADISYFLIFGHFQLILRAVFVIVVWTVFLSLFVTLFLFAKKSNRFERLVIIGAAPGLFWWSTFAGIHAFNGEVQTHLLPGISQWVGENFDLMQFILVVWWVLLFSLVLFLRFNQLRRENAQKDLDRERLAKEKEIERSQLIEQQKIELEKTVEERTGELKQSLDELKSTQRQLVQQEKMASLGEMTAGVAHEIQNPLNFVNNFSEVNQELVAELKEHILQGDVEQARRIADNIDENEQKISYHGKRADGIVKGMLLHSRTGSGEKELTDINKLMDEYVRLSYHGMRSKDKSFNAQIKTDFDESIGKINVVQQDIGRVLLNLLNNAFYAVNEKRIAEGHSYKATVSVQTKKLNGQVEIKVMDNGKGIPHTVVDKIFQPFFTTKPAGQGTGLGLSISYDIVKAHGGELSVDTKDGEYSEFKVMLPA
jgi:signal transduction histidine kinase